MIHYVLGFIFDNEDDSKVILIKKNHPSWMKGCYNGIGGIGGPGEIPLEAMRRKCREECGVRIRHWVHVFSIDGKNSDGDYRIWVFKSIAPTKNITTRNPEEPVSSFNVDDMNALHVPVVSDIRWMIPLLRENFDWDILQAPPVFTRIVKNEKEKKD